MLIILESANPRLRCHQIWSWERAYFSHRALRVCLHMTEEWLSASFRRPRIPFRNPCGQFTSHGPVSQGYWRLNFNIWTLRGPNFQSTENHAGSLGIMITGTKSPRGIVGHGSLVWKGSCPWHGRPGRLYCVWVGGNCLRLVEDIGESWAGEKAKRRRSREQGAQGDWNPGGWWGTSKVSHNQMWLGSEKIWAFLSSNKGKIDL